MASIEWTHAAKVPADPDAVFAWMSDFREDDHARPAYCRAAGVNPKEKRTSHRKIISREGDIVRLEDTWGGRTYRVAVTVDRPRREVRLEGEHGYGAVWRAVPSEDGTRVETEGRFAPRGLFGLLAPLFASGLRKEQAADFRGHIADLTHELGGK